jgi:isoamylase
MQNIMETPGNCTPLGLSFQGEIANFALFSSHATQVYLGVFLSSATPNPMKFPMHKTGDIWHIGLKNIPPKALYAFQCEGPYDPQTGDLFKNDCWLADPYAKVLETPHKWGTKEKNYRGYIGTPPPFDWGGAASPKIPIEDLIIYEMHVRGFTEHPSSEVKHPGTFLGILEKIPYLKSLGINAIELMPIFEFDEIHCKDIQPQTGEPLPNYWGYNSLFFFAPMRRFAASESIFAPIEECKMLVKALHQNGIEVILDVVFNHTGEGNEKNYFVNFRGIDNRVYYMVDSEGHYRNYTGCGNTVNCNHPVVQNYILDCLTYWIEEMHIDGFRFDLASIFTRDIYGHPVESPPIVQAISNLCKLKDVKLIAEAWDASGLYQVGLFPNKWKNWSDWNGKYRDTVRRFIKGTPSQAGAFADVLSGSQSIYKDSKSPLSSINFITAHDGYTMRDLVTYQMKHNYENGEMNRDGNNQNDNWNCGAEGPTINADIAALREKQMRNFFLALFLSQGIPMLLMGDEYGHSRRGNNNPFVQDNDLNWFLWQVLQKNEKIFLFVSSLIAFRKKNNSLRHKRFLTPQDIEWHGLIPYHPNWDNSSQFLAFTLLGTPPLYAAFNASGHSVSIELPSRNKWYQIVRTDQDWEAHYFNALNKAPLVGAQITLPSYTALLCFGDC